MNKSNSGLSPVVKAIGEISFEGAVNVIPKIWYQRITYTNKRGTYPYMNAILILSEIIYWYKPKYVVSEETGKIISVRNKFASNKLQKNYDQLGSLFGLSYQVVQKAIIFLRDHHLITTELRDIETKMGMLHNVMYIEPIPENIKKITYLSDLKSVKELTYIEKDNVADIELDIDPISNSIPTPYPIQYRGDIELDIPYTENTTKTNNERLNTSSIKLNKNFSKEEEEGGETSLNNQPPKEKENLIKEKECPPSFGGLHKSSEHNISEKERFKYEANRILESSRKEMNAAMKIIADTKTTREQFIESYIQYSYEKGYDLKRYTNGLKKHAENLARNGLSVKRELAAAQNGAKPNHAEEEALSHDLLEACEEAWSDKRFSFSTLGSGKKRDREWLNKQRQAIKIGLVESIYTEEQIYLYIGAMRFLHDIEKKQGANFIWLMESDWVKFREIYNHFISELRRMDANKKMSPEARGRFEGMINYMKENDLKKIEKSYE